MSTPLQEMLLTDVVQPAVWLILTILGYLGVVGVVRPGGGPSRTNPLFISGLAMLAALALTGPSLADHATDVQIIDFLRDLVTAALALPSHQPLPF